MVKALRIRRLLAVWAAVVLLSSASRLGAQQSSAIRGTVTDSSGGAIVNAEVTVVAVSQGISLKTSTNSTGAYIVPNLEAGTYTIRVTAPGYKVFEATNVILRIAQNARVDAEMAIGAVTTQAVVNGTDMGTVETESSQVSYTITGQQITQMVLNGRDFAQLVTLSPGVVNQTGSDEGVTGVQGSVGFSIEGGRPQYNNWELDGSTIMDNGNNTSLNVTPSLDAISETHVLTSNYGAQYGRNGSGTIQSQTKSGTEQLHGDAFEFLRNDAFNARNYFQQTVPEYKKHDFGFTVGGPVWIPHIYAPAQKKTFFFYSQEWRKAVVPGNVYNHPDPSLQERGGDFSDVCPAAGSTVDTADYPDCPINPATSAYYPNNAVSVDPNAKLLLVLFAPPNVGTGAQSQYQSSPALKTSSREELFRIDHQFSDKLRGFYRFIYDSWDTVNTPTWGNNPFPTVSNSFNGPGVDMVANLTYAASPSLVNEFIADYTTDRIDLELLNTNLGRSGFTGTGFFNNGFGNVLPSVNLVGNSTYGGGMSITTGFFPWKNSNPTYSYRDDLTKTTGKHTFTFGTNLIAAQKNEPSSSNQQGTYTFSTSSSVTTGNSFADFLLGRVANYSQTSAQPKYYNRYEIMEPYFQDDWRLNPKLTLNLGLRFSLFGTYHDISGLSGNFVPSTWSASSAPTIDVDGSITGQAGAIVPGSGNLFNGLVRCGQGGTTTSCMKGHLLNPAPRVGFAYDLYGNGKFSVRGGYGVFFEHTNGNESNSEALEGSAPVVQTPNQYNFIGYDHAGGAGLLFPLSLLSIPTKAIWPYVHQYNLSMQGDVWNHVVVQVSYTGSRGIHLPVVRELNQLNPVSDANNPYAAGQAISAQDCSTNTVNGKPVTGNVLEHLQAACTGAANQFRPFIGISGIKEFINEGQSSYDSLQVAVTRYFGSLSGSLAYTYGHSIDVGSNGWSTENPNGYNPHMSRASSDFDERHVLAASAIYNFPSVFRNGLGHSLLDGWQLSDLTIFQTGTPFSIINTSYGDNAGTGNTVSTIISYPDIVGPIHGKVAIPHPAGVQGPRLYNSDAFAAPRGLTYGNAGRNLFSLPARTNFDMGLFKKFAIREDMNFEFRAEAFNVFNHTQWSGVNNSSCYGAAACSSSSFLTATSAHNPRIMQLAGKFVF
jgi:hypothetical protein